MGILPIPRTPPNPPRRGGLKKAQEGLVRLNRRLRQAYFGLTAALYPLSSA